jgi:NAD(P)-dependent dehydrogenase (short-subunit alcohol dehydrogenase family)
MNPQTKTVLITGASSGIGMETALYFHERKWNVVATMRNPQKRRTPLHEKGLPDLVHLDVMDEKSIRAAVEYAVRKYGRIDVLVNNAGYAVYGPFEATTKQQAARQFDTNIFGLMAVTREALPHFREQKGGVMINIASMGGRIGFPLYSVYNATKWAVEGFSEAVSHELAPLGIRVKIIEPGVILTDFYGRSLDTADAAKLGKAYDGILRRSRLRNEGAIHSMGSKPSAVARTIYRAATDGGWRLRYIAGIDGRLISALRRILPYAWFNWVLEKAVLG